MQNSEKQIKSVLPFKVGAVVELTGKVTKRVRREGECKLVIEPGDVPGFVVFADCPGELETVRNSKIRKGSLVSVRGKFQSYGSRAVCLSECKLEQVATLKKENGKPDKT
jgi:ribosome-associated protein YbcJ (S4-like RNA binding protein)